MKKKCLFAFIIVVLAVAIILVFNQNPKSVSSKIMDYYDKTDDTNFQVNLYDYTDFEWDNVIIYKNPATEKEINETAGINYGKEPDLCSGMIFIKNNKVVYDEVFETDFESPFAFVIYPDIDINSQVKANKISKEAAIFNAEKVIYNDKSRYILTQTKNAGLQDLKSTDLSDIKIDDISIGSKFNLDDFSNYTNTGRYKYEEIVIDVDHEDNIKYIFSCFENYKEKTASITVENKRDFKMISDITALLGNHYIDQNEYDSEDLLMRIYYDKENNIIAEIVYNKIDKALCYIRLIDGSLY